MLFLTLKAKEQNVIGYNSYADVEVNVIIEDQFPPNLLVSTGGNSGFISEGATFGDPVYSTSNTIMKLSLTDNDYVSIFLFV